MNDRDDSRLYALAAAGMIVGLQGADAVTTATTSPRSLALANPTSVVTQGHRAISRACLLEPNNILMVVGRAQGVTRRRVPAPGQQPNISAQIHVAARGVVNRAAARRRDRSTRRTAEPPSRTTRRVPRVPVVTILVPKCYPGGRQCIWF